MKNYQDVRRLLASFGAVLYMGNRLYDIEMAQIELKRLYEAGLLERQDLLLATRLLEEEHHKELHYQQKKSLNQGR